MADDDDETVAEGTESEVDADTEDEEADVGATNSSLPLVVALSAVTESDDEVTEATSLLKAEEVADSAIAVVVAADVAEAAESEDEASESVTLLETEEVADTAAAVEVAADVAEAAAVVAAAAETPEAAVTILPGAVGVDPVYT